MTRFVRVVTEIEQKLQHIGAVDDDGVVREPFVIEKSPLRMASTQPLDVA